MDNILTHVYSSTGGRITSSSLAFGQTLPRPVFLEVNFETFRALMIESVNFWIYLKLKL
jgi:hypothetical protein